MTNEHREEIRGAINSWIVRGYANELLEAWDEERAEVLQTLRAIRDNPSARHILVYEPARAMGARIEGKP